MDVKIHLKWDYKRGTVTLLLPGYILMVLERFRNRQKFKQQDLPHLYTAPKYGQSMQFARILPKASKITEEENIFLEQVLGALLYYGMAIDCTMLVFNCGKQKNGMRAMMDAVV